MAFSIISINSFKTKVFRWHDAGDIQNVKHLLKISIPSIYGILGATLMSVIDGVYLSKYDINAFNGLILILPFIVASCIQNVASFV